MHEKVAPALLFALTVCIGHPAFGQEGSRSPCQPFQLEAYRQQYQSADQCWETEKGMRGATEACCNMAFGQPPFACRREIAKLNIDWVFTDSGARLTYFRNRRGTAAVLEAVLAAQGHNPNAKREIEACGAFSDNYARLKDPANDGDVWVPVGCEDARRNADWILFRDRGARATYDSLRRIKKMGAYEAAVGAQAHNPSAQGHLALCRDWVDAYLWKSE